MFNFFKKKKKDKKEELEGKEFELKKKEIDYEKELEENVSIYVMPERFRTAHKQKSKAKMTGLFIIAGGVVFLIVASFLLYYFLIKTEPVKTGPIATSTDSDALTQPEKTTPEDTTPKPIKPVVKNPKESYMEIKAEFDIVANFNSYEQAILKHGSKNKIRELEKEKRQVEGMPESFKENIVSLVIQLSMPKLREIGEIKTEVSGSTATLTTVTRDLSKNGTIIMLREDNLWKLDSESWEDVKDEDDQVATSTEFSQGIDSDNDGLTDKEENIFGSELNSIDSDGDGFNDITEVFNLYNPAGSEKLEDSATMNKYSNNTYNYNLIYPASWSVINIGGDESVMFRSGDNHFIQVIVQSNTKIQLIDDWYKTQFEVSSINASKKVNTDNWQGIKSDNDLIIYLTDKGRNYIYTLNYIPDESSNILEYMNIFEMIIKSFMITN